MAIGILATSILLVVGVFGILITASQKVSDLTVGSVVADGLLSQQIYQLVSTDSMRTRFFQATYGTPTVIREGAHSLNTATYFYRIYCQDATFSSTLHCTATDHAPSNSTALKRLDVVVWWHADTQADGQPPATITTTSRPGMGTLYVFHSRLLWPTGSY